MNGLHEMQKEVVFNKVSKYCSFFSQLEEERRLEAEKKKAEEEELKSQKRPKAKEDGKPKVFRSGVGKFLDLSTATVT